MIGPNHLALSDQPLNSPRRHGLVYRAHDEAPAPLRCHQDSSRMRLPARPKLVPNVGRSPRRSGPPSSGNHDDLYEVARTATAFFFRHGAGRRPSSALCSPMARSIRKRIIEIGAQLAGRVSMRYSRGVFHGDIQARKYRSAGGRAGEAARLRRSAPRVEDPIRRLSNHAPPTQRPDSRHHRLSCSGSSCDAKRRAVGQISSLSRCRSVLRVVQRPPPFTAAMPQALISQ